MSLKRLFQRAPLVDDVKIGDYVIIHVGYALTKLVNKLEAEKTLRLFQDVAELKYINEFRDHKFANAFAQAISSYVSKKIVLIT